MKIVVTGGAGYIGSILIPALLSDGHTVTVIDSFRYTQTSLLDVCYHPRLTIIRGDVRDDALMSAVIKEAEFIIPLACLTGAPLCAQFPQEAQAVNLDAINMMLRLRNKGQAIIYPATQSGYAVSHGGSYCTEQTPLQPISRYGKLKAEAEKLILSSGNAIVLRLATVFGISPRMRLDLLVNDFVFRAVNDRFVVLFEPHFKRNFVHVRDIARVFVHCLANFDTMRDQIYNVGLSDANLSKFELCQEIKKKIPDFYFVEAKIGEDPDKRNYIVSNEKIEKTGFKPEVSLSEGISELIKGFQILKRNQFSNV